MPHQASAARRAIRGGAAGPRNAGAVALQHGVGSARVSLEGGEGQRQASSGGAPRRVWNPIPCKFGACNRVPKAPGRWLLPTIPESPILWALQPETRRLACELLVT